MEQIAFSFDRATLLKIGKGFLISLTGGAALAILDYLQVIEFSNPILTQIIVIMVPSLTNAVKSWMQGIRIK